MKLSIIIPIYNVERYIEKCLRSCINQEEKKLGEDYEIVCVNDGTLDKSAEIAKCLAIDLCGVQVVEQINQGLSAARNAGLQVARGEYVWFVDSDDWIEPNCLGRITNKLKDDLDILQLQYRYVYDEIALNRDAPFTTIDGTKSGKTVTIAGGLPDPAQFSIYRTEFLRKNGLNFQKGIYHEDSEFKPRATYLAEKIASDTDVSYNYLQRTSGSITSKFRLKNGIDIIYVMNSLMDFVKQQQMDKPCTEAFYRQVGLCMNTLLFGYRQLSKSDQSGLYKALTSQKHLFRAMIKSKNLKYQLEGVAFGLSLKLGFFLHKMIR